MTRPHDVSQLSTGELETARRELRASLGLITPGSPAHVPIQAHMQAIDAELAGRVANRQPGGSPPHNSEMPPGPPYPPRPAGRDPGRHQPSARAGHDTERDQG